MAVGLVEVLHERAPEGDVQQLGATAHAQHRQPPLERGADQRQLPVVATALDLTEVRMRVLAVQRRVGVGATGHHQAVEAADHVDRIGIAGELHRQTADGRDALRVLAEMQVDLFAVQRALREMGYAFDRPAAAGQTDERPLLMPRVDRDRQALDAADEVGAQPLDRPVESACC